MTDEYARLYRRHAQELLVFFQRRVFDPEAATDLVAETFVRAIADGPGAPATTDEELGGRLWSIARAELQAHRRRTDVDRDAHGRQALPRRGLTDEEVERIEELAGIADVRETVAIALETLPADQREAVRLRVVHDLPYAVVAQRLGVNEAAVRARVSRGLRALQDAIAAEHEGWWPEP